MNDNLQPGDRVRLKDTVSFGTVVEGVHGAACGRGSDVTVEWDGREGAPCDVSVEKLVYVRPPPRAGGIAPLAYSWESGGFPWP